MRFLRFLTRHPIAVFGAAAVAFLAWVWADAFVGNRTAQLPDHEIPLIGPPQADVTDGGIRTRKPFPLPPGAADEARATPSPKVETLLKLKPGMTRTQVEELVGAPAAQDIHPVTIADGKATYHTTYEADLGAAPTVRPIGANRPVPKRPAVPTRNTVTLEFDATQPGHPLLGIYYPDPLF